MVLCLKLNFFFHYLIHLWNLDLKFFSHEKSFPCHKRKIFQILSFHSVHYVFFKVLTRKGQLEELYVDNQELEGKRREVEAWLARMEAWQDRMQPVAPDLLESQVRENKVNWINTLNMKTCWGLEILCMQNLSSKFLFKESFAV